MKNIVLITHKLLGILLAFLMIIVAFTGSYLVWDREINPVIRQSIHQVKYDEKVSSDLLSQTIKLVQEKYPKSQLSKVILPSKIGNSYRLIATSAEAIREDFYIDPYQNKILGYYRRNNTFDPILSKIHTELLGGNIGKIILGLSGIGLFILALTGLYLWKGWKKLTLGFKIRWSSKPRFLNYDLHQVIGVFSLILVINIAITGAVLALDKPLREILLKPSIFQREMITSTLENSLSMDSLNVKKGQEISLDLMFIKAQKMLEGKTITEVKFPPEKNIVEFRYKLPHEITPLGKNYLTFDPHTGEIIAEKKITEETLFKRFKTWFDVLHYGTFWGLITMIIYLFFGIVLATLSLTGFFIWLWKAYNNYPSQGKGKTQKTDISQLA